jgi:hypothetical protein
VCKLDTFINSTIFPNNFFLNNLFDFEPIQQEDSKIKQTIIRDIGSKDEESFLQCIAALVRKFWPHKKNLEAYLIFSTARFFLSTVFNL